jgi:hypothetical protein
MKKYEVQRQKILLLAPRLGILHLAYSFPNPNPLVSFYIIEINTIPNSYKVVDKY